MDSSSTRSGRYEHLHLPLLDTLESIDEESQDGERRKKPHRCFYCCCNMRESVVTVQVILGIVASACWIIAFASGYYKKYTTTYTTNDLEELTSAYQKVAIILGVGIAVAIVTIVGAIRYSVGLVGLGALYVIIGNVLSTYYAYPVMNKKDSWSSTASGLYFAWVVISTLLVLYPHLMFIYEVKTGILAKEVSKKTKGGEIKKSWVRV